MERSSKVSSESMDWSDSGSKKESVAIADNSKFHLAMPPKGVLIGLAIGAGVVGLAMIAVGVAALATIGALTAGVALIAVGAAFIISAIVAGCFIRNDEIGGAKDKDSDLIEETNAEEKPLENGNAFAKIVKDAKGTFVPTGSEKYKEV